MTRFTIIRHGQTLFNAVGRVQGWCDSPLTKTGIMQARSLHQYLNIDDFKYGFSSTSERCVDTLNLIIGDREIETKHLKELKEIYFGNYEGEFVKVVFPDGTSQLEGYVDAGGETKADARDRFIKVLKEIAVKHSEENILIVSHGSVLKEVFAYIDNEFQKASIQANGSVKKLLPNCSVSILDYDGQFHLVSYGDISYQK